MGGLISRVSGRKKKQIEELPRVAAVKQISLLPPPQPATNGSHHAKAEIEIPASRERPMPDSVGASSAKRRSPRKDRPPELDPRVIEDGLNRFDLFDVSDRNLRQPSIAGSSESASDRRSWGRNQSRPEYSSEQTVGGTYSTPEVNGEEEEEDGFVESTSEVPIESLSSIDDAEIRQVRIRQSSRLSICMLMQASHFGQPYQSPLNPSSGIWCASNGRKEKV